MSFPEQENSDLSNPLRWFDTFIFNNTPYLYREDFFSEARRLHHDNDLKFDIEESSFSYIDFTTEDGAIHRTTFSYSNYLSDIIEVEKIKSIKLIKQNAESIQSTEELEYYLKKIIDQLEYLINLLKEKHNTPIREFECVPKGVYKIVIYLKTAHKSFLPNPLPEIFEEAKNPPMHLFSNILEKNQDKITPHKTTETSISFTNSPSDAKSNKTCESPSGKIYAFSWTTEQDKNSTELYKILTSFGAIKRTETDLNTFKLAFNGEEIINPLNIRWHFKNSHHSLKAPLLRMLYYLENDFKLITEFKTQIELAHKVKHTFVDESGNEFLSLETAISELKKEGSGLEIALKNEIRKRLFTKT